VRLLYHEFLKSYDFHLVKSRAAGIGFLKREILLCLLQEDLQAITYHLAYE